MFPATTMCLWVSGNPSDRSHGPGPSWPWAFHHNNDYNSTGTYTGHWLPKVNGITLNIYWYSLTFINILFRLINCIFGNVGILWLWGGRREVVKANGNPQMGFTRGPRGWSESWTTMELNTGPGAGTRKNGSQGVSDILDFWDSEASNNMDMRLTE